MGEHLTGSPDETERTMNEMRKALVRLGLLGPDESAVLVPLSGGIASDIWKADIASGSLCIKKALHQLKVPVE